jgi:nitrous-oxide reductase
LYDISGDKMKLLLDFPTTGEPHYAEAIPAAVIAPKSVKIYQDRRKRSTLTRPKAKGRQSRARRQQSARVHDRHPLPPAPDNIEGVKIGDEVYFHVTNLEQDWDVPHGFAVKGASNAEMLIMPGETCTLKCGHPDRVGRGALLLHRLLLGAAPGNAGLCARFARRIESAAEIQHRGGAGSAIIF